MIKYRYIANNKPTKIVLPEYEIKIHKLRNRMPELATLVAFGDNIECFNILGEKIGRFAKVRGSLTKEDLAYYVAHTLARRSVTMGRLISMGDIL